MYPKVLDKSIIIPVIIKNMTLKDITKSILFFDLYIGMRIVLDIKYNEAK